MVRRPLTLAPPTSSHTPPTLAATSNTPSPCNPGAPVSVEASPDQQLYNDGDVVELTAVAEPGWVFGHWGSDLWGSDNPAQITVTQDLVITAVFYEQEPCEGDLNSDGQVNLSDLTRLLENYGHSPRSTR